MRVISKDKMKIVASTPRKLDKHEWLIVEIGNYKGFTEYTLVNPNTVTLFSNAIRNQYSMSDTLVLNFGSVDAPIDDWRNTEIGIDNSTISELATTKAAIASIDAFNLYMINYGLDIAIEVVNYNDVPYLDISHNDVSELFKKNSILLEFSDGMYQLLEDESMIGKDLSEVENIHFRIPNSASILSLNKKSYKRLKKIDSFSMSIYENRFGIYSNHKQIYIDLEPTLSVMHILESCYYLKNLLYNYYIQNEYSSEFGFIYRMELDGIEYIYEIDYRDINNKNPIDILLRLLKEVI